MKKPLSKLERVPLRETWKHEANDFTPWLAKVWFPLSVKTIAKVA